MTEFGIFLTLYFSMDILFSVSYHYTDTNGKSEEKD